MKKTICLVLSFLLLFVCGVPAHAAESTGAGWSSVYESFILNEEYLSWPSPEFFKDEPDTICFGLYDLDMDGFPELVAYNGCPYMAGACNYIFTCRNGQITYAGDAGYRGSVLQYYPTSDYHGLFCNDGNMGISITTYYEMAEDRILPETVMEQDYNALTEDGNPAVNQITEDAGLFLVPQTENPVTLQMFTASEIRAMGWQELISRYPFVSESASSENTSVSAEETSWGGAWKSASGDEIVVTDVTDTQVTLEYSGYAARNTADGKLYFTLPYLDDAKTSVGESEDVLEEAGFRTVFTLTDGKLSMYYNDHMYLFDRVSGSAAPDSSPSAPAADSTSRAPFYGVWFGASKAQTDMEALADTLCQYGYDARVLVTTDWDNLNSEMWYVATSGLYASEAEAYAALPGVQAYYPDAYVKYSGNYKGSAASVSSSGISSSGAHTPFYGVWFGASKAQTDMEALADTLRQYGYDARVLVTTDWDNLNSEMWYVATSGLYASEAEAYAALPGVQAYYPDAYVKYSGNYKGSAASVSSSGISSSGAHTPFYGVWFGASKAQTDMETLADTLRQYGYDARVLVTTDWDNLNSEMWYVATSGLYVSEVEAYAALPGVQAYYPDAYVKYSGNYKGNSPVSQAAPISVYAPFYGIWCSASKAYADMESASALLTQYGLPSQIFVTTDWSNLNPEFWYVLSAGTYASEAAAKAVLSQVQSVYPDAYVKYSGDYIGG